MKVEHTHSVIAAVLFTVGLTACGGGLESSLKGVSSSVSAPQTETASVAAQFGAASSSSSSANVGSSAPVNIVDPLDVGDTSGMSNEQILAEIKRNLEANISEIEKKLETASGQEKELLEGLLKLQESLLEKLETDSRFAEFAVSIAKARSSGEGPLPAIPTPRADG